MITFFPFSSASESAQSSKILRNKTSHPFLNHAGIKGGVFIGPKGINLKQYFLSSGAKAIKVLELKSMIAFHAFMVGIQIR